MSFLKENNPFSPVGGSKRQIFITAIYFLPLLILQNVFRLIYQFPFQFRTFTSDIISYQVIVYLILSFAIAIVIHKSLIKGFLVCIVYIISSVFLIAGAFDSFPYILILIYSVIFLGIMAIPILFRYFYKINSQKIRIAILVLPYIVLLLAVTVVLVNAQNLSLERCNSFNDSITGESIKKEYCLRELALQKKDISICPSIELGICLEELKEYIDISTVCNNRTERCYYDVARILRNQSICEYINREEEVMRCKKRYCGYEGMCLYGEPI